MCQEQVARLISRMAGLLVFIMAAGPVFALSPPWLIAHHILSESVGKTSGVTLADPEYAGTGQGYKIRVLVDTYLTGPEVLGALKILLVNELNSTKIEVVDAGGGGGGGNIPCSTLEEVSNCLRTAFQHNRYFVDVSSENILSVARLLTRPAMIQYSNDDLSELSGIKTVTAEALFEQILKPQIGNILVSVSTSQIQSPAQLIFPQLALGGESDTYDCLLIISNKSALRWIGSMKPFKGNHEPWSVSILNQADNSIISTAELRLDIPANATRKYILTGDKNMTAGYLSIAGDQGYSEENLSVSCFCRIKNAQAKLINLLSIPPAQAGTVQAMPVDFNTAFAWCAAETVAPFNVSIELFDGQSGKSVSILTKLFEGHMARFVGELFPNVADGFVGKMVIRSNTPLFAIAIRLDQTESGAQLAGSAVSVVP